MKRIFIFCLSLIAISTPLFSQVEIPNTGPLRIVGPGEISIDANNGDVIEATYFIKNWSDDTIIIDQIVPECICVTPEEPTKTVLPNSVDSILLYLNTKHVPPGPYFKRTFVDYGPHTFELILKGNTKVIRPIYKKGQKPIIYTPENRPIKNIQNPHETH